MTNPFLALPADADPGRWLGPTAQSESARATALGQARVNEGKATQDQLAVLTENWAAITHWAMRRDEGCRTQPHGGWDSACAETRRVVAGALRQHLAEPDCGIKAQRFLALSRLSATIACAADTWAVDTWAGAEHGPMLHAYLAALYPDQQEREVT